MTPQPQPQLPIHVDSTQIVASRGCLQKFYREFCCGLRPPGLSIDLHAGACFATALETVARNYWDHSRPLDECLTRAYGAFTSEWGDFEIPPYKATAKTPKRMWEAVLSYFQEYDPTTDDIVPYRSADGKATFEYTFAIPLEPAEHPTNRPPDDFRDCFPRHPSGSPFLYCGRFDLLGQRNGRAVVRDDKTSGRSPNSTWAESWDLRNQFIGYVWACQQCGIPTPEVEVRGITILKESIRHAKATKIYSQFLIDRWHEQLRRDLWRIRRAWDEQYFDWNLGDQCTQYGNCIFMPLCTSQNPETWTQNLEVRHWNPLLKNPVRVPDPSIVSAH